MRELLLLKYGEIALKGLNKQKFESVLHRNVRHRVKHLGNFDIRRAQSTFYVEPKSDDADIDRAYTRLSHVFGFSTITRAAVAEKDFADISRICLDYFADELPFVSSFRIQAKRSDKSFPMNTPELCRELGGVVLDKYPDLTVDLKNPELTIVVEIRDFGAYLHGKADKAAGGMPVGTSGGGMLLLSGGIDSPVAGYMMAKRGIGLCSIHFESPPYTSERARDKVLKLAQELTEYANTFEVHVVPFTEIQETIRRECDEDYFTIIMRRLMMRIATRVAKARGCGALITGESLAQVASQTLQAIACTDAASEMPVLRPLIGMDKMEIIDIAHKIGTFETSILPYEDCCTVFTPRHPKTKPVLERVQEQERKVNWEPLIEKAVANISKQVAIVE